MTGAIRNEQKTKRKREGDNQNAKERVEKCARRAVASNSAEKIITISISVSTSQLTKQKEKRKKRQKKRQ